MGQGSKTRSLKTGIIALLCFLLFTSYFSLPTYAPAAEWAGVDESVVEKYAEEHGRTTKDPVINTDQGDLLLFMFLLGGLAGGFAAGYYWRTITEQRPQRSNQPREKNNVSV